MTTQLICIVCPRGCPLTAIQGSDGTVQSVTGNGCKRGIAYAQKELTAPTRMVTTVVKAVGSHSATLPCKTREPVPKAQVLDVVRALKTVTVTPPIAIGDVVCANIANTNIDIIATAPLD